jgi:hypothetical protein
MGKTQQTPGLDDSYERMSTWSQDALRFTWPESFDQCVIFYRQQARTLSRRAYQKSGELRTRLTTGLTSESCPRSKAFYREREAGNNRSSPFFLFGLTICLVDGFGSFSEVMKVTELMKHSWQSRGGSSWYHAPGPLYSSSIQTFLPARELDKV